MEYSGVQSGSNMQNCGVEFTSAQVNPLDINEPPNLTMLRSFTSYNELNFQQFKESSFGNCSDLSLRSTEQGCVRQFPMSTANAETSSSSLGGYTTSESNCPQFEPNIISDIGFSNAMHDTETLSKSADNGQDEQRTFVVEGNNVDERSNEDGMDVGKSSKVAPSKCAVDAEDAQNNATKKPTEHSIPGLSHIFPRPQCFAVSTNYPIPETASVGPFQIFGFSAQVPQYFHTSGGFHNVSENEGSGQQEKQETSNSIPASSSSVPHNQYDPESTFQVDSNMHQCQYNVPMAMPLPPTDGQDFLITQKKTRKYRSTSISIIEYGDIGPYPPYQPQIFQQSNGYAGGTTMISSPVVRFNTGYQPHPASVNNVGLPAYQNVQRNPNQQDVSADTPITIGNTSTAPGQTGDAEEHQQNFSENPNISSHISSIEEKNIKAEFQQTNVDNVGYYSNQADYTGKTDFSSTPNNYQFQPPNMTERNFVTNDKNKVYSGSQFCTVGTSTTSEIPVQQNQPIFVNQCSVLCGPSCSHFTTTSYAYQTPPIGNSIRPYNGHGFPYCGQGNSTIQNPWAESFTVHTGRRYPDGRYSERGGIGYQEDGSTYHTMRTALCEPGNGLVKPRKMDRMSTKKASVTKKTKAQKNRRFACTHVNCNKRYFKQDHLEMHLRKHAGERPYSCTLCDRRFQRSDQLKRHQRRHTGEKPYECLSCHRAFARSDHLKTHMKTHTDRPYHCQWEDCKKKFAQPEELCQHYSTHKSQKTRGTTRGKAKHTNENGAVIRDTFRLPPSSTCFSVGPSTSSGMCNSSMSNVGSVDFTRVGDMTCHQVPE